jgi:hypothetical protein
MNPKVSMERTLTLESCFNFQPEAVMMAMATRRHGRSKCDAVDNFDTGHCPACQDPLSQTASFYFTTAKDEIKILERWGCQACKNQKDLETELPPLSSTQN